MRPSLRGTASALPTSFPGCRAVKLIREAAVALLLLFIPMLSGAGAEPSPLIATIAPVSEATFTSWFGPDERVAQALNRKQELALSSFADRSRLKATPVLEFSHLGPVIGVFHFSLEEVLFPYAFPTDSETQPWASVREPTILLAGYEGQPEVSEMACAKRTSSEHNLAFRCNAPVAMNVPGGKSSSSRFLTEMETETGLRLGRDFWAGDLDAGTGARLLTARDAVTSMRFTLRYIDERGFTRSTNSCADRGRWRWSYVCITDVQWAAKSMIEQCQFVVDEMLSVEGGPVKQWTFAPLPAPGTADGTPIAIGFTVDPLKITVKARLCREVVAQEQISTALFGFQTAAFAEGLAPALLPLTDRSPSLLGLSLQIDNEAFVVARLRAASPGVNQTEYQQQVARLWRKVGGSRLCTGFPCVPVLTTGDREPSQRQHW